MSSRANIAETKEGEVGRLLAVEIERINSNPALNAYLEDVNTRYTSPDLRPEDKLALNKKIEKYESEPSSINRRNKWRLFIDGDEQEMMEVSGRHNALLEPCNPLMFDKDRPWCKGEPGYYAAMSRAFELMEKTLHQPLTVELIIALHDVATHKVTSAENKQEIGKGFIDNPKEGHFDFVSSNLSVAGFKEIIGYFKSEAPFFGLETRFYGNKYYPLTGDIPDEVGEDDISLIELRRVGSLTREQLTNTLKYFIAEYNAAITLSRGNDDLIIHAIAKFAHKADLLHPFADGNIRTICFLVANKLLLENGLSPAAFADPNRFDGFSVDELCNDIKHGIEMAKKYGFSPIKRPVDDVANTSPFFAKKI